jgi:hypothetical protein
MVASNFADERQIRRYEAEEEEDESKCNWDIEIIQFVVESFICMFPDKLNGGRRSVARVSVPMARNRDATRGELMASTLGEGR